MICNVDGMHRQPEELHSIVASAEAEQTGWRPKLLVSCDVCMVLKFGL
uniref:Uncharacterized protein n=1 Tax=Nymphaea colorata TaxID=210225 RepID=A0A5K1AL96_9MAGN